MKNILENKFVKYCSIGFIGFFVLIIIIGAIVGGEDTDKTNKEPENIVKDNVSQEEGETESQKEDDVLDYVYDFEVKDLHKALLKPEFHHLGLLKDIHQSCPDITIDRMEKVGTVYSATNTWMHWVDEVIQPYFTGDSTKVETINKWNDKIMEGVFAIEYGVSQLQECEKEIVGSFTQSIYTDRDDFARNLGLPIN